MIMFNFVGGLQPVVPDAVLLANAPEIWRVVDELAKKHRLKIEVDFTNRWVAIHKCNVDLIQEIRTELSTNNPLDFHELEPFLDERVLTLSTPRPLFQNGKRDFVSEWLPVSGPWVAEIQSIPIGKTGYTLMDAMDFSLGMDGEPFESSASIVRRRLQGVAAHAGRHGGTSMKRRKKRRL